MTQAMKCDRCGIFQDLPNYERTMTDGKDTTPQDTKRTLRYHVVDAERIGEYSNRNSTDLCVKCKKALADFMEGKPTIPVLDHEAMR